MGSPMTATLIGKRVNFVLSEKAHSELVSLAKETRRSMTELVRLGLGLVRIAIEAGRDGNRLIVADSTGQPIKEIVLPG
jgi:hypothetical protein